ncbi:MAG: NADH-quinone oxidoreductase subunit A [Gemmatimonadetes bacterium]|jgi:NADH-quinone oxidoreductase subunit A|nr:MAG: NADH-quinone oxidoreductase subunit A [Gemmatimonadota bacterium]
MNQPYLSFLLLLGFVAFNAVLLIGLSHLLAPRKPTALKDSPYESGMPPLGNARERFSVKFYLVAMLFIIFDIETVFLIPWGTIFLDGGGAAGGPSTGFLLVEMLVFMLILAVGYVYVWKRGALQWD